MNDRKSTARVLTPEPGGGIRRPSQLVLARLGKLERTQKGQIAAVEMGSQEIFVGKDVVEATLKGWKKYPGQSFYFLRIGYPAVHRHRGGTAQAMRIRLTGRIVDAEPRLPSRIAVKRLILDGIRCHCLTGLRDDGEPKSAEVGIKGERGDVIKERSYNYK